MSAMAAPDIPGLTTRLVVGMEVHVELATRTKMWTAAPNVAHRDHFEAAPNTLLSPVVIGLPGTLPVMNRAAVEMAIKVGLALGCEIADIAWWDRKSYYYPDLPKNYQISQYDHPLCGEGLLEAPASSEPGAPLKAVRITRAHLEEDAGKLLHEAPGGGAMDDSIVDLNRAGTPLLEIVTEPDIETPEQAVVFGQTLRNICRFLGVTEGVMQRGHMRFEPNINVVIEQGGRTYRTPIVEIKNLNSFKAVYGAIAHEYHRQVDEWLETGRVMAAGAKSTRGWDDNRQVTVMQREKEDAHDYRYFPDPDLVRVEVDEAWIARIRASLPELPLARQRRYVEDYGLPPVDASTLVGERETCLFYELVLEAGADPKRAASMLLNNLARRANDRGVRVDELGVSAGQVKGVLELLASDKISSAAVDRLLAACEGSDATSAELAEREGLLQVSDAGALEAFVDQVLADPKNAKAVADIRAGKGKAIGALVGQIMKLSRGQANPKLVSELIETRLN